MTLEDALISNSTKYPTQLVLLLIRRVWAATKLPDGTAPLITVRTCSELNCPGCGVTSGNGKTVTLRLGDPETFPIVDHQYRKTSPIYTINDWRESLIATAAHEFWHVQEIHTMMGLPPEGRSKFRFSEVKAERAAYAALLKYREKKREIEDEASRAKR